MTSKKKRIQQAKSLLMKHFGMCEPAAHKFINKSAMDPQMSMASVADWIIAEFDKSVD